MTVHTIELAGGIDLEFELQDYSKGEPACHDCPGEAEMFDFSWTIKIEDIMCLDDLNDMKADIDKIMEGTDIQELMEAEYKEQNQPEPDFD